MIYLKECLQEKSKLVILKLNLSENNLGDNHINLKYLSESLSKLYNMKHLEIYLLDNNLG